MFRILVGALGALALSLPAAPRSQAGLNREEAEWRMVVPKVWLVTGSWAGIKAAI